MKKLIQFYRQYKDYISNDLLLYLVMFFLILVFAAFMLLR